MRDRQKFTSSVKTTVAVIKDKEIISVWLHIAKTSRIDETTVVLMMALQISDCNT